MRSVHGAACLFLSTLLLGACSDEDPVGAPAEYPFAPGFIDMDVDPDAIELEQPELPAGLCREGALSISFIGQSGPAGQASEVPDGGCATDQPHDVEDDSGLADLMALNLAPGQSANVDILIDGATVSATHFGTTYTSSRSARTNFWVQDGLGYAQVFLNAENQSAVPIRVGQRVRFRATRVTNYQGALQIAAMAPVPEGTLADIDLLAEEQLVFYQPRSGTPITAADINRVLHVSGEIVGGGDACGGSSRCWELAHGDEVVMMRSSSNLVGLGALVEYAGPVVGFSGTPQLDTVNFRWMRATER